MKAIFISGPIEKLEFEQIEVPSPVPLSYLLPSAEGQRQYFPKTHMCAGRKYLTYIWDALDRYDVNLEKQLFAYILSAQPSPLPSLKQR